MLTDALQEQGACGRAESRRGSWPAAGAARQAVRRREHASARDGKALHFYLNFSGRATVISDYTHGAGTELLAQRQVTAGQRLTLAPWDLLVVKE